MHKAKINIKTWSFASEPISVLFHSMVIFRQNFCSHFGSMVEEMQVKKKVLHRFCPRQWESPWVRAICQSDPSTSSRMQPATVGGVVSVSSDVADWHARDLDVPQATQRNAPSVRLLRIHSCWTMRLVSPILLQWLLCHVLDMCRKFLFETWFEWLHLFRRALENWVWAARLTT